MQRAGHWMRDNSDVQEIHDGKITDMRIESVLSAIFDGRWDEPELDTLYTELVQEFINPDVPTMLVSVAGKSDHSAQGLLYLSLFGLNYTLVHVGTNDWPGDFDFLPAARYAIQIQYPDDSESWTNWIPGVSASATAIASLMQYCRELSLDAYNAEGSAILLQ